MNPTKKPSAVSGLRRGIATTPRIRSDDSIGRQEDIGRLVPPRPEKPVRFTLDLDQAQHTFLKTWAAHRGVGGAQVMRALLQELEDDPGLAIRIRDRAQAAKR
jgi:hypothetical protein